MFNSLSHSHKQYARRCRSRDKQQQRDSRRELGRSTSEQAVKQRRGSCKKFGWKRMIDEEVEEWIWHGVDEYLGEEYLNSYGCRNGTKRRPKQRNISALLRAHAGQYRSLLSGVDLSKKSSSSRTQKRPYTTYTENKALTFTTSGDPVTDFVFQVLPDSRADDVRDLVDDAWELRPLSTLRAIFQLRDIRQGKGDRGQFYECVEWMAERHPQTLLANLHWFPKYGYWKDLLVLIWHQIETKTERLREMDERAAEQQRRRDNNWRITQHKKQRRFKQGPDFDEAIIAKKRAERAENREANIQANLHEGQQRKVEAHRRRAALREDRRQAIEAKMNEPHFRALYRAVVKLFARRLTRDVELMKKRQNVSLCGKWAPRINGSFDKRCHLARAIAVEIFCSSEEKGGEKEDAMMCSPSEEEIRVACDRYRREVCVPLRQYLACPEVMMSARRWNEINYDRVPSVCMQRNKKHFVFNDSDRFTDFLSQVAAGTKKIASGAVMPHELVEEAQTKHDLVSNLQFRGIIRSLRESGSFESSLAICDVSGSMSGTPMMVAIALSLILSDLNEGCWHGKIVTFSSRPQLFVVPEGTLHDKVKACKRMDWGMNTNYEAVFDLLLDLARQNGTSPSEMVKCLYVFSDMEFDCSGGSAFKTSHEKIVERYGQAGFEVPQIVFWNLRSGSSRAIPATSSTKGVAMVSGFCPALLKMFMQGTEARDWSLSDVERSDLLSSSSKREVTSLDEILKSERYSNITTIVD